MEINKLLHSEKSSTTFNNLGIRSSNEWIFSNLNLIMGENGDGKSRIIKAIKEICQREKNKFIYMDFTQISNNYQSADSIQDDTLIKTPRIATPILFRASMDSSGYVDFISTIEHEAEQFTQYIISATIQSLPKEVINPRLKKINNILEKHLKRKIVFGTECKITAREEKRRNIPLSRALKEMSPGERSILYFALALLCIETDESITKNDCVILIDEPEEHLHPKALIELVRELKSIISNKRRNITLFIASHSFFLIPLFEFKQIIHVSKGKIATPSGHLYSDLYSELVGNTSSEVGASIFEFMRSIEAWNFANFISECFTAPTVSSRANFRDPQCQKLFSILRKMNSKNQICILDYGGGSGRIAKCMELCDNQDDSALIKKTKYDIFDPLPKLMELPNTEWAGMIYKKKENIMQGKYDVLVLFNVLHEISIDEWKNELNEIMSLLNDDGIIVFGERSILSVGEKPFGKSGYLVLGGNCLHQIFGQDAVTEIARLNEKDPTVCYTIAKKGVNAIDESHIIAALKQLLIDTDQVIETTLKGNNEAIDARKYAFYCQQKINAEQALKILNKFA